MVKVVKSNLRKVYRATAELPIVGRFVRIWAAAFRLPEIKAACLTLSERQNSAGGDHSLDLTQRFSELNQQQRIFETEQLPALLQALSDLNQRQLSGDNDRDNLVQSVPVALRKNARELVEIRGQLEGITDSMKRMQVETVVELMERRLGEARNEIDRVVGCVETLRNQLESVMSGMQHRIGEVRGQVEDVAKSMNDTRHQLETGTSQLEQWFLESRGQVQGALGAMDETRAQVENAMNSIRYLLGRVEFVRREVMFEMKYGVSQSTNAEPIKTKTEILSPEKLAAARKDRLRLNLGCGHIQLSGYLNVDRRGLPGVDIVAEVDDLPFGAEEVDEIFSSHLLEHFPVEQLKRQLLPYLVSLLKRGGEFHAVVPDAQTMTENYVNGSYPFAELREVTFGSQDYVGDFHYNMFTPESLSEALQSAGLRDVRVIEVGRRNGACYEFEIAANK